MGPKFIAYHDVLVEAGGDQKLALARFARHFSAIAEMGYSFAPMSAFLAGAELGPKDVVVTFDDGTRSVLTCALPVLREYGVIPTLFVLTGFMGLVGKAVEFFSWDDIDKLQNEGVEFGCHGVGHVPLNEVEPERMHEEILESTAALRAQGIEPGAFAYPFGRYDDATKSTVRDAGYQAAFTVMAGGYDRYEIRRRLFTGIESPVQTRFVMADHFFEVRETARSVVPRRFLKQEQPIAHARWGPEYFGVKS